MNYNLIIFISYFLLITISILGYGLLFHRLLNIKIDVHDFGYVGLFGIYILLIYSYLSNLIIAHSELHNLLVLIFGITAFIFSTYRKNRKYKKEYIFTLVVFVLLFISLIQFKNHDDFPYYHFPYTYYLTQQSFYFGIGEFNHGFRTPSSIFYLNSLFYLPYAKFYLFNFTSIFVLGFANIILLKKVHYYFKFLKIRNEELNFINFLSLLSFIFINIFFYRLSEYGTDRAAMILIFLFIIELLNFLNFKKINKTDLFCIYLLGGLIISLKAFYILYIVFILPLFFLIFKKKRNYFKTFKFIFINKYCVLFLILLFFVLTTYFINTGCIIYPLSFTCFEHVSWGIPLTEVKAMNDWYELWSKGGATPNLRVENPQEYIKGFNWVNNWIDIYFFNKVSDFILGIILLISIFLFSFRQNFFEKKIIKINYYIYLIYLLIFILGIVWFYNHPALRYGGYHILALLTFIPISIKLSSSGLNMRKYTRTIFILIFITIFIFIGRNMNRITKEVEIYGYKPISQTFYFIDDNYFRIQKEMDKLLEEYNNCEKKITECNSNPKIKKIMSKIIFINQ
tara:strand:- start:2554 stop:4257 length:1704 start_codon:yes stop_codon:yes gene_type:complete